jgi:hypothetical protein
MCDEERRHGAQAHIKPLLLLKPPDHHDVTSLSGLPKCARRALTDIDPVVKHTDRGRAPCGAHDVSAHEARGRQQVWGFPEQLEQHRWTVFREPPVQVPKQGAAEPSRRDRQRRREESDSVGVNQVGLKLIKDLPTPREQLERLSQAERRRVGVQRNPMHAHPIDPLDPGFERRFLRTSGKAIAGDENGCLPVDFQGKPTDDRPD